MDPLVTVTTQSHEVVVLGDDLPSRTGEVEVEVRHVTAEIVDVEDQLVGKLVLVAPDHPPGAEGGEPELVPRSVDGLHPRDPEVEEDLRGAERGEETAARAVDVDVDIEARPFLDLVEPACEVRHRFVVADVRNTEGRHDEDRVLVDSGGHLL